MANITKGRRMGTKDFLWVRMADLQAAGIGEQLPIPINRKWLEQMNLITKDTNKKDIPKITEVKPVKDKIEFTLHETT